MRRLLKVLAMLLLALPVLLFIAWFYLHTQLKMAGISSWSLQLAHLSWHQANLNQLDLVYENDHYRSEVSFHDLKLRWSWPGFFRIQAHSIQLASATITVQQTGEHVADTAARLPVALSADWRLPTWLPKLIKLDQIDLLLPCASGQCALQASLVASADEQQAWQASLSFKSPQYQQTVKTDWQLQQGPDELAIQATLLLDQQLALSFKQQLAVDRAASTELALAISPPSPASDPPRPRTGGGPLRRGNRKGDARPAGGRRPGFRRRRGRAEGGRLLRNHRGRNGIRQQRRAAPGARPGVPPRAAALRPDPARPAQPC